MDESVLKKSVHTEYFGCQFVLTTKHKKSIALNAPIETILGATVHENIVDTDTLGTFSGEIHRKHSALDTVKKKAYWGIESTHASYALASEGSFGPHPMTPFIPANHEILYFIDTKKKFELHVSNIFLKTNYEMKKISLYEELLLFAEKIFFPSHALILCPFPKNAQPGPLFKGIQDISMLESAFLEAKKYSKENAVWVETDMRAHLNPSRMNNIQLLGEQLAQRLSCYCPKCSTPGWGKVKTETGLPCKWCQLPTDQIKNVILGCTKCSYQQHSPPDHGNEYSDPAHCHYCNP